MKEYIDGVILIIVSSSTLIGLYKATIELSKEKTLRLSKEQEEETKRVEIKARESSLGSTALSLLKEEMDRLANEIKHLHQAKEIDGARIKSVEEIIRNIEMMYKFIEQRFLNTKNQD